MVPGGHSEVTRMLEFDPEAVRRNAHEATTEDLLDRVTAYRSGMEPEAVAIIEAELARRGVGRDGVERHEAENCANVLLRPEGFAYRCSYCRRPAVVRRWGWHWLWGLVPVLPRVMNYCAGHAPAAAEVDELPEPDEEP
jgi:hypothetical protein